MTTDNEQIHLIAREAANAAVIQHLNLCPVIQARVDERLRAVEVSQARLIGFMIGSGLLGGTAGAIVSSFLP